MHKQKHICSARRSRFYHPNKNSKPDWTKVLHVFLAYRFRAPKRTLIACEHSYEMLKSYASDYTLQCFFKVKAFQERRKNVINIYIYKFNVLDETHRFKAYTCTSSTSDYCLTRTCALKLLYESVCPLAVSEMLITLKPYGQF